MSSEKKKALKQARESLAAKEYREVLSACKTVLKEDRSCYEAYLYIGKAAYHLGEYDQAELSYQKATELNEKAAQAWQGLSELYHETQQWLKAADADQILVDLAHRGDAALSAKLPQLVRRLGAAHAAAGQLEEAEVALRDVLANSLPPDEKLSVLAQLADVQLKEDTADLEAKIQQRLQEKWREAGQDASKVCVEAVRSAVMSEAADEALELDCDHATPTLKDIVCSVAPTPPYVKYHDTYLRRLRRAVNVAAPGSMDRHNRRVAVLEVCRAMMEGRCAAQAHIGMGCASPYAYETALRLLEIEEEIAGASLPRVSSAEFTPGGLRGAGSLASFSAVNSPRSGSGMATPTAAAIQAASQLLSPGSFFGTSLRISTAGSFGAAGTLPPLHSGAATPSAASLAGALLPGPATPKRDMSAARLTELVHHPMAAATHAAGATMAAQERESFSQLAAEASTGSTLANTTANGTPGILTPVGSLAHQASIGPSANPLAAGSESIGAFGANASLRRPGGLTVAVASSLTAGGGMSGYSSAEMLTAASPRWATGGSGTPRTPTRGGMLPAAAPLLMADHEMIGRKLAHAFPWNATAQVHLAMALRRREAYVASAAATIKLDCSWQGPNISDLSCSALAQRLRADRARQAARKAWLAELLAKGLERGAPVVSGMIGLAELRLEAGDAAGALQAAKQGLKFVYDRSRIGNERARNAALVLNLLAGQALLGTGQLTDAGRIFVRLSQRVSEGEVAFGSEAVGMPATSIRQQAIRGLAQVALAQGDSCQALHHYGELVSKALMGRGSAEHWAYAEYGWLLFREGNADAGRYQLETALDVLYKQAAVTPGLEGVAAGYHCKLARIYWALGGNYRVEQEYCLQHLLDAAAEPGPQQAEAFEWLGHWYGQVAADELRARKCYQRALALNPTLEGAGNALCDILQARSAKSGSGAASGSATALEQQLLEEMLLRAPDAHWARARLARLQLATGQFEQAVTTYQAAIRSSPKSAQLWEGLAASYQSLGRHASALKSYCRSLELDPARPYALMSAGALYYMAGSYQDAAKQYRAALEHVPEHPAALLGLAEVLLSSAGKHMAMGAAGAAAVELLEAAERTRTAVSGAKFAAQQPQADSTTAAASRQPLSPSAAIRAAALDTAGQDTSSTVQSTAGREQQAQQLQHLQYSSNLVTAWKLLGDILLQQHMLQATAAAAISSNANSNSAAMAAAAVTAALQQLAARRDLLRDARRAYSRALALSPTCGELWGDVALCFSHEARLLQQLQPPQAQQGATAAAIAAARAAAVRTARGGLRLAPASSWLWGVLANALAAVGDPAAAEYSYSRALALDPTAAMLWVQLGRLYSRHGSAELAEQCYEAARGVEPTLVSVWEAMAATAAARSTGSTGSAAAAAAAEHAVGLGGGPESWLQYATAGLSGRADDGLLLACACKTSAHQPLLLPPHAALAAALEARGQYSSAVSALQYCLALLQEGLQQGQEGLAALGLTGFGQCSRDATHRVLLLQAAGFDGVEGVVNPDTVRTALELALARNLALSGQYTEAVQLYGRLENQGSLDSNPVSPDTYSWICYGYVAQQCGQAGLCSRVLERAIEGAPADTAKLHAVTAMLQHLLGQGSLEVAFSLLLQHLPQLSLDNPTLVQPCTKAWLALVAAAASAGQADLQVQVVEVMRQAAEGQLQHLDMAWVECELKCIAAAAQAASGAKPAALRTLAHAVHTCPWHTPAWLRLADAGLAANPRLATAVYRACPALQPESNTDSSSCNSMQVQQVQHATGAGAASTFSQQLALSEVLAAASSRATALSGQVAAAVAKEAGQEVSRLRRLLHALPGSPDVWYCLALAALLQAIGDGQAAHFRRAGKCCLIALNRINQLIAQLQQSAGAAAPSSSANHSSTTSRSLLHCSLRELLEVKVGLMVAVSECHQHSRQPGCLESAHQWAMDALGAGMAAGSVGTATAHRQVGRMLALEGMTAQAEMAYRQAVVASGSNSNGAAAGAVLELAKLLAGQGRQQEAAQLLHGIWEGGAATLSAAGAAVMDEAPAAAQVASAAGISGPGPHFVEVAALEEALMLANLGQFESARAAAAAGLRLATAAGDSAPAAAELVTATIAVQAAAAAPADGARNLVLEARWAASAAAKSGMALPGTVGTAAAGIGAAVLAQVELARNKPERAYDAIGMSFGAWVDQAIPAQVLVAAGELTGQVTDCAAAVHTAPWLAEGWEKLKLAAIAAGRLVDVL